MPLSDLLAPFFEAQSPIGEESGELVEEHAEVDGSAVSVAPDEEARQLLKTLQNQARTLKARQQRWRNQTADKLQRQNPTSHEQPTSTVPDFVLEASRYLTPCWKRLGAENHHRHRRPQTRALWSYLSLSWQSHGDDSGFCSSFIILTNF